MNHNQAPQLTLPQAVQAIQSVIRSGAKIPILLLGSPGMGKTEIVHQIRDAIVGDGKRCTNYAEFIPSQDFSIDLKRSIENEAKDGLKYIYTDRLKDGENTLVFVDEIADIDRLDAASWNSLVYSQRWGDIQLGQKSLVIAAANLPEHGASAQQLPSQSLSRCLVLCVKPDIRSVIKYGKKQGWHESVMRFLTDHENADKNPVEGFDKADFCGGSTSRNLEQLSRLEFAGFPSDELASLAVCQGLLGVNWGAKYNIHRKTFAIPVGQILLGQKPIPSELATKHQFLAVAGKYPIQEVLNFASQLTDQADKVLLINNLKESQPENTGNPKYQKQIIEICPNMAS